MDTETGKLQERALQHREEAETFYRELAAQGMKVGVGMEASGHARWFERWLAELNFELWIGDAAEIRTKRVRKQKTDRQDAQLILKLMLKDDFPRIWVPSWENRDLRQLLWHRHRMVQARTRLLHGKSAHTLVVAARKVQALRREVELVFWHGFGSFQNLLFDGADLVIDGGSKGGRSLRCLCLRRGHDCDAICALSKRANRQDEHC